jgi:hypothetical protein
VVHVFRSATWKSLVGRTVLALAIISWLESRPVMRAWGKRVDRTFVEFAGPQPRSIMRAGVVRGTLERRSRAGWVRSASNFRYCAALQSLDEVIVIVVVKGLVDLTLNRVGSLVVGRENIVFWNTNSCMVALGLLMY